MKYCAKCGTQMSDDAVLCPQCYPESNKQQPLVPNQLTPLKNTSRKTNPLILANVMISTLTLIATIGMYFISPSINNSTNNNDSSNSSSNIFNSTCPADEYGYHDWSTANCTKPSYCYECGAYRDDKLGQHHFHTDNDGLCSCWYCGILYEVYMDSLD